ncbi:MAG: hypothetical protein AAFX06_10150 [Planctomycetota bacterium]
MPLLQDAFSQLRDTFRTANGEPVTYQFGTLSISIASAVRGQSVFDESANEADGRNLAKSVDWIIYSDELQVAGIFQEPHVGAKITDSDGVIYQVAPGLSESGWRWLNSYKTGVRIHTVVESQPPFVVAGIGYMGIGSTFIVS